MCHNFPPPKDVETGQVSKHALKLPLKASLSESHLSFPLSFRRGKILDMESRIERMESILAASGLSSEAATPATTGTSADLDDQLSMLLLHDEGSSTFIGKYGTSYGIWKLC